MSAAPLNALWLETFVMLCDIGHFTRAAALLNMTQPGVSQHLRKLEEQIGAPLISRDGKSFTLTPAGDAVRALGLARRQEERALREAIGHDDPHVGPVSIACSGPVALLLHPHLMTMMEASPRLSIRLEAAPAPRVIEGVAEGRFDLGVIDDASRHPRLEEEPAGEDEIQLLLPPGASPEPTAEDLARLGFVGHPDGRALAEAVLELNFPGASADCLAERCYVNQVGQIPEPVLRGLGWSVLAGAGVKAHPRGDALVIATLPRPLRRALRVVSRRGRQAPARVEHARAVMKSALGAALR